MAERSFTGAPSRALLAARLLAVAASIAWQLVAAPAVHAHALDPVLFELTERPDGKVDVTWKAPNAKTPGLNLQPVLPPECQRVGDGGTQEQKEEQDATISHWVIDCGGSLVGKTVGIAGLEGTDALLRIQLASGSVDRRVLGASHATVTVEGIATKAGVLRDYFRLGAEHIGGGVDHLLFVFGLLLLAGGTRLLFVTITAFTLGHSVTLALAALQVVKIPQAPVEVVIALTIWILAVELARDVAPDSTMLRRRPWAMAFTFGLLHGLGFAGALREAGLPPGEVPLALLSFNLGIEAGQLAFVGIVLAAMKVLASFLQTLPPWVHRIPVYAMGTAATYWILARAAVAF